MPRYEMTRAAKPEPLTPKDAGVSMDRWGKDHWSILLYIESICVNGADGIGTPDRERVQCNPKRHPGLVAYTPTGELLDGSEFGIRLYGGKKLPGPDYDEWDCIFDLECYGLVESLGTGIHPEYRMTEWGIRAAAVLHKYKAQGGQLNRYRYKEDGD